MARIWLPQHEGKRYEIVKRLRALGVFVPGWQEMDVSHLEEILQWQEEKAGNKKAPEPVRKLPREQVIAGLKDYLGFLRAKRENRRRLY